MRSALGKGLGALISDETVASVSARLPGSQTADSTSHRTHSVEPEQPRRTFSEASLADLVSSIKEKGILQPILVSPTEGGNIKLSPESVAGARLSKRD